MDNIFISLPDGKVLDVPRGTTALDVAKQISPRLASAALVARVTYGVKPGPGPGAAEDAASGNANEVSASELIDLSRPIERDAALAILTEKDPDALFVFPPFSRAFAGCRRAGTLSGCEAGHRAANRHGIFLRIHARAAVQRRRF